MLHANKTETSQNRIIMKDNKWFAPTILAAAIVVAGLALRSGMVAVKDRDRKVSVKGLAEKEVMADKVIWPLVYQEVGNDPNQMYSIIESKNAAIVSFLKAGGVNEAEISVNPPAITDRKAYDYGENNIASRYKATSVITVNSNNVDKIRALMNRQGELMKQGIPIIYEEYGDNRIVYEFTGLNDIKPAMVEEATKNARATAQKFAEDSNSKVGKISHASQGQFSIYDRDANTPYIKNVRVVITMDYLLED